MHIFHWTASCFLSRMGVAPIKHLLNHLYHHPSSHPFFRLSFAAACVGSSTTVRQLVCCDYWALYLFLVFPHLWSQGVSQTCLTGEGLFLVWCSFGTIPAWSRCQNELMAFTWPLYKTAAERRLSQSLPTTTAVYWGLVKCPYWVSLAQILTDKCFTVTAMP